MASPIGPGEKSPDNAHLSAADRDRTAPVWDMSQERMFLGTSRNQMFNFLILSVALFLGGAMNAKTQVNLRIMLFLGAVFTTALIAPIFRLEKKLSRVCDYLMRDPNHPFTIAERLAGDDLFMGRVNRWVPLACAAIMWIGFLLASMDVITAAPR
jgi:hypothetical protein